jgi:hypothetical protein
MRKLFAKTIIPEKKNHKRKMPLAGGIHRLEKKVR